MLAEAAEVEHNLLCSYLYAAFSLRRQHEGLSAPEADTVARWRELVVGVAVQEMGHLATVNNLIVALGGAAHFDRPNFPVPPGYHPASFELRLTPFDRATLEHFIFLERPDTAPLADPEPFRAPEAMPRDSGRLRITPSARDYATIGDLYRSIGRDLKLLAAARGPRTFVCADRQASARDTGIKGLLIIHDLATALAALRSVVEQGEGGPPDAQDSHFARFCAISEEWDRLRERNPDFDPAHPAARDPVMRRPASGLERVWITAPHAVEMVDLGNALYGALLTLLAQLYEPGAPQKQLTRAAIDLMHGLSRTGCALARLPARSDSPGVNAGLTFAVPRASGARTEVSIVAERLEELADIYECVFNHHDNPVRNSATRLRDSAAS
jgi:hypothetical protein